MTIIFKEKKKMDPRPQLDFSAALQSFVSGAQEGSQQLIEFKEQDPAAFIIALIQHLGDTSNPEITRKLSAVFLYKEILPKNINVLFQSDPEIHENLRDSATNALFEGSDDLTQQTAQLLGLFYALEFTQNQFIGQFNDLLHIADESHEEPRKSAALLAIEFFLEQSCGLSQGAIINQKQAYQNVAQDVFDIFIGIAQNPESPQSLRIVVNSIVNSMPFFYRVLSFAKPLNDLISIVFDYIGNDELFTFGYSILQKLVENFYAFLDPYIENIFTITQSDMQSDNEDRVIESCIVWRNIGTVENSAEIGESQYSGNAFQEFFMQLVTLIASGDPMDFEYGSLNDKTPQNAAFSCFLELAKAIGEEANEPIFEFVRENIQDEDWRIRYCSVLLLYVATTITTFTSQTDNILSAFQIFIACIEDEAPVVVEKAMWSLGIMCDQIPDLAQDPERFELLLTKSTTVMTNSKTLYSRACWLLSHIFSGFSPEEDSTLLAENFDTIADHLLSTAKTFNNDSVQDAYGALNKLIEHVPLNITESYNTLLVKIMEQLSELLQSTSKESINQEIWICSIIQAATMNVGQNMAPHADRLMEMLTALMTQHNNDLTDEVLPAMGAIARALGPNFAAYTPSIVELVFQRMQNQEFAQPIAVFIGDIYSAQIPLPDETNQQFVAFLFGALEFETITLSAKGAVYSALADVARNTVPWCYEWLDNLIDNLIKQVRVPIEDEDIFYGIISCCQTLVPILTEIEGGDKRVKSLYHVFECLSTFESIDGNIIYEAILLIDIILQSFGRKVNIMLNKPVIKKLLQTAQKSEEPNLSEKAAEVIDLIDQC